MTSSTATQLRAILDELGVFYRDRHEVLRSTILALLSSESVFLLGPPGTGKTSMLTALCRRIEGARFASFDLDGQTSKDDLFGPLDVARYDKDGVFERDITGTLADVELTLIDEIGRASKLSMDPLLRILEERTFRNGKTIVHVPLISAVAGSNDPLKSDALFDRFLLRHLVDYLKSEGDVRSLLQSGSPLDGGDTTITLQQLRDAQLEVQQVTVPEPAEDAIIQIRRGLFEKSIRISDRRLRRSLNVLRAEAWLSGAATVTLDHIPVLRHVYWLKPEQIPDVTAIVMRAAGTKARLAARLAGDLAALEAKLEDAATVGLSERLRVIGQSKIQLDEITQTVEGLGGKTELQQALERSRQRLQRLAS